MTERKKLEAGMRAANTAWVAADAAWDEAYAAWVAAEAEAREAYDAWDEAKIALRAHDKAHKGETK